MVTVPVLTKRPISFLPYVHVGDCKCRVCRCVYCATLRREAQLNWLAKEMSKAPFTP